MTKIINKICDIFVLLHDVTNEMLYQSNRRHFSVTLAIFTCVQWRRMNENSETCWNDLTLCGSILIIQYDVCTMYTVYATHVWSKA